MNFIHEDPEFDALLAIVAANRRLSLGLIEKDYWVTHALWALQRTGFEIWFKGGTSLSKGFSLIERFSEDLDLRIDPGGAGSFPVPENWTSTEPGPTRTRTEYFNQLIQLIEVPGASIEQDEVTTDQNRRSTGVRVIYPGRHLSDLGPMRPFVLLEIGNARITPSVGRNLTSFVHDYLLGQGHLADHEDNRPKSIRCVHPLVTLVEKLDAIQHRFARGDAAAGFVRHYEDAAAIIAGEADLPRLEGHATSRELLNDMRSLRQIRRLPATDEPAYLPDANERWRELRAAHSAIEAMYWGERRDLNEACRVIRAWIEKLA